MQHREGQKTDWGGGRRWKNAATAERAGKGGGRRGREKNLLICKIVKIGYKDLFGKMARDEWEGIGLRWSRDDERAEKLTREKIKKYQKKKKERGRRK